MSSPQTAEPKRRRFSASAIGDFLFCRQKYFIERVLKVAPPGRQFPQEFGTAMHGSVDYLLANKWDALGAKKAFDALYEDDPAEKKRTRQVAHTMIDRYTLAYKDEPRKVYSQGFSFVLKVEEFPGVELIGTLDRVIDWYNRPMPDEFKTTSELTADWMKQFFTDYQATIYIIAARQLVNPEITALLADAALVAKSDPKKLKSEPLLRSVVERPVELLQYQRTRILQILGDMIQCHEAWEDGEQDYWYENPKSCKHYGICKFLQPHCKEPFELRPRIRQMDFKPIEADPRVFDRFKDCKEGVFKV